METITITRQEYIKLKKEAELVESLLVKLVRGLEDIRTGKIKPWKKSITN